MNFMLKKIIPLARLISVVTVFFLQHYQLSEAILSLQAKGLMFTLLPANQKPMESLAQTKNPWNLWQTKIIVDSSCTV